MRPFAVLRDLGQNGARGATEGPSRLSGAAYDAFHRELEAARFTGLIADCLGGRQLVRTAGTLRLCSFLETLAKIDRLNLVA